LIICYVAFVMGKMIELGSDIGCTNGTIRRRERLTGMFQYHYRDAARPSFEFLDITAD